jgi:ankyrin repeat protein
VVFKPKKVVLALLDSGIDINEQDDKGVTPLYVAVLVRRPDIIELLLSRWADVNVVNLYGFSPYECLLECLELESYYKRREADVFGAALKMVDLGANINSVSREKHPLLFLAVQSDCGGSIVLSILERGASVHDEECWDKGKDPLYLAANKGNWAIAKVLLDHDIKTYSFTGTNVNPHWEALFKNVGEQRLDSVEDLNLSYGRMQEMWFFAACTAAKQGHDRVIKLFIEYGIPVSFVNYTGNTLLSSATRGRREHEDIVQALISTGGTKYGETPWTHPVANGFIEL